MCKCNLEHAHNLLFFGVLNLSKLNRISSESIEDQTFQHMRPKHHACTASLINLFYEKSYVENNAKEAK